MGNFKIDISNEIVRFENHLNLIDNNQIIFSGIFGIGKTYFINEFFNDKRDKYELIYLSPINYTVSQNEDIFEYIKYDILFELLKKNIDLENIDFSKILTSQFFIQDNIHEIFSLILENTSKLGKEISNILSSLKNLKTKFDSFHEEVQINEENEIIDYLKMIVESKGLIYEENRITQLICKFIDSLKSEEKQIILVVDDLDRIDPEHIFRLFNVFACHFDNNNGKENKFNLDKIVFVCDIENIRNIYHSKYGMDVDFTGYIDKFYSREIFVFDNTKIINQNIPNILRSMKLSDNDKRIFSLHNLNKDFEFILINLIKTNSLNLRTLLKFTNKPFDLKKYSLEFYLYNTRILNLHFSVYILYDFLLALYGSHKSLISAIIKCENTNLIFNNTDLHWQIGNLLTILDFENHRFIDKKENKCDISELDISIKYVIMKFGDFNDFIGGRADNITRVLNNEETITFFPYFKLLRMTFEKIYSLKVKKISY